MLQTKNETCLFAFVLSVSLKVTLHSDATDRDRMLSHFESLCGNHPHTLFIFKNKCSQLRRKHVPTSNVGISVFSRT